MGIDMRKNILFALFGMLYISSVMANNCSFATNAQPNSSTKSTEHMGGYFGDQVEFNVKDCGSDATDIYYCDDTNKGKYLYAPHVLKDWNVVATSVRVEKTNGPEELALCKDGAWAQVTKQNCCKGSSCQKITWTKSSCGGTNCTVYTNGTTWAHKKCATYSNDTYKECCQGSSVSTGDKHNGQTVYTCGDFWSYKICGVKDLTYKECCDSVTPTDYSVDDKTVYKCDSNHWTYKQCKSMEDCSDSICTDANTSGTLQALPWNATVTPQVVRKNIVYYDDACNQLSYYKCSQGDNYQKYIWAHIEKKSNNFPWVITKGTKNTLLFCNGSEWKKLEKKETLQDPNCFRILNICGVFYIDGNNWSNKACSNPFVPEDRNNDGNSECTGCCQDVPLHSDVQMSMAVLNNFVATADVSVWVTKDGKFNYARLGTDVASGVVMGTVGGLVSNAIIKKNQLEKGMEGYYCAVGSDSVADYGDEFIIGF